MFLVLHFWIWIDCKSRFQAPPTFLLLAVWKSSREPWITYHMSDVEDLIEGIWSLICHARNYLIARTNSHVFFFCSEIFIVFLANTSTKKELMGAGGVWNKRINILREVTVVSLYMCWLTRWEEVGRALWYCRSSTVETVDCINCIDQQDCFCVFLFKDLMHAWYAHLPQCRPLGQHTTWRSLWRRVHIDTLNRHWNNT